MTKRKPNEHHNSTQATLKYATLLLLELREWIALNGHGAISTSKNSNSSLETWATRQRKLYKNCGKQLESMLHPIQGFELVPCVHSFCPRALGSALVACRFAPSRPPELAAASGARRRKWPHSAKKLDCYLDMVLLRSAIDKIWGDVDDALDWMIM
eukprot:scaffold14752_cov79-Cyclotella_meneghiniana.AAC.1